MWIRDWLSSAQNENSDNYWSDHIATQPGWEGSVREYILPDSSRVDILTAEIAWEVEWAAKWKEAIGQALFYSISTDRRPGIILLLKGGASEDKYYLRCLSVCGIAGIKLAVFNIRTQEIRRAI